MQYSPKLKVAMAEIKAILDKHDIAGIVHLHTPGHGEYLVKINPSYSCAWVQDGVGYRLRTDPTDSKEIKHQLVTDTANMIGILTEMMANTSVSFIDFYELLKTKVDITNIDGGKAKQLRT